MGFANVRDLVDDELAGQTTYATWAAAWSPPPRRWGP